jgi:hypothetical protein
MAGLVPAIRVFFDGRFAGSISCLQRNAWKKHVGGQSKSGRDDKLDSSGAITCSRVTDGKPSRNASIVSPASRYSMRVCTSTRVPQKTGDPPITSESRLITGCVMEAN